MIDKWHFCIIKNHQANADTFFAFNRSDRVTVQEREQMQLDLERKEEEKKKVHEERAKSSRKVQIPNRHLEVYKGTVSPMV